MKILKIIQQISRFWGRGILGNQRGQLGTVGGIPIYEVAIQYVEEQFAFARNFATQAVSDAQNLLQQLALIAGSIKQIDTTVNLTGVTLTPPAFTAVAPIQPSWAMTLPAAPPGQVFQNITLGDLKLPDLNAVAFNIGVVDPAAVTYGSPLLTALKARLLADVQTDIDRPNVETAKWNRGRARDLLTHQDALGKIKADWSKSSLPLPDGAMIAAIEVENKRYADAYDDRSGQIAIEESDLAIKVRQAAVAQATQLEGILMNFLQTTQTRIFEASKATIDAQVKLYDLIIARYRMMVDIYRTVADVRIAQAKADVDIYVAEVTAYKAQIEAEVSRIDAIVKTFVAQVDAYRAQILAYQALTNVEIEILKAQLGIAVQTATLQLKNAEIQIAQYEKNNELKVETVKAMGTIVAQNVAGALSSIHANAGMTRSDSATANEQVSSG